MTRCMLPLFVLLLASPVLAQNEADAVRALEARRFGALTKNDMTALAAILSDDLTYTHTTGVRQTKQQFLDSLQSGALTYDQIEPRDVAVRVYGNIAVVTGRSTMHVTSKTGSQVFDIYYLVVDILAPNGWQTVAWQSTRIP